ncbi:MAG: hypothetical protein QOG85_1949 [Gaiellaceae bacterium]|jgi:hypothetical protein|nr:hypothetical protein [Gaiellaceae bacterium]
MRRLLRRLPSPAVVIASVALFVALAGAGVAASTAFVRSIKPIAVLAGQVDIGGTISGAGLSGGEKSVGVYVITVRGDSFGSPSRLWPHIHAIASHTLTISGKGVTTIPPTCQVVSEDLASNGGGTVEVDCFDYDPATGSMQPADMPFDLQVIGPSR